jgi:hypothetical protein
LGKEEEETTIKLEHLPQWSEAQSGREREILRNHWNNYMF